MFSSRPWTSYLYEKLSPYFDLVDFSVHHFYLTHIPTYVYQTRFYALIYGSEGVNGGVHSNGVLRV